MPKIDVNMVVAVIFAVFMLYYLGRALAAPARVMLRVFAVGMAGMALLFVFNLVAGIFSFRIGINALTALIVGYMGLPGLAMLVAIQTLLG